MSISRPAAHFEPLKTNKDCRGKDDKETGSRPSKSGTLESAHLSFYFLEIGFGCWLGWNGVWWLGFTDRRRTYRGIASIGGAIVLVCHGAISVTQKYLTPSHLCNTVIDMANVLSADKQTAIIAALAEGSSIRSIERITGVHRDTIMRLGVKVGKGCEMLMDSKMQGLECRYLQFDELWGFIGKKERHCSIDDNPEFGDVWTFCAIDAETKVVPTFKCGKRNAATANAFVKDVAGRMANRVQISTDALHSYVQAVEESFGADVDYGQIVKVYVHDGAQHPERKYSAPSFASAIRRPITGNPDMELVSTSYVERLNATTRLHVKRLSRLTLAFSKKLENFQAAVALHFAYYNFVLRHNSLRCTPVMAAGIERDFWSVGQLVEATT
jgi:IS1 family transposase